MKITIHTTQNVLGQILIGTDRTFGDMDFSAMDKASFEQMIGKNVTCRLQRCPRLIAAANSLRFEYLYLHSNAVIEKS